MQPLSVMHAADVQCGGFAQLPLPVHVISHAQDVLQLMLLSHELSPEHMMSHGPLPQDTLRHDCLPMHSTRHDVAKPQLTPLRQALSPLHWTSHL